MIRQLLPAPVTMSTSQALEEAYLHAAEEHLRTNFVSSIDGAVEIDGVSGPLGGQADRAAFLAMRAVCDVILVGAGTMRAENYGPVKMGEDRMARRASRGQAPLPRLAVVSRSGALDASAPLFASQPPVIVYTTSTGASRRDGLADVAEVVAAGDGEVSLTTVVSDLRSRGLGRILCEGGPSLFRALMSEGLVDEICLTISPILAVDGRANSASSGASVPVPLQLHAVLEGDDAVLLRYRPLAGS